MLTCLGLERLLPSDPGQAGDRAGPAPDEEVERLLAERQTARAARDFETADRRRDELAALGWEVRDTPEGSRLVPRR
jgi:cysteinyl-tRNA synthetase